MLEIASEITLCLLLAALIGFILGFIVAKASGKKSSRKKTTEKEENTSPQKEKVLLNSEDLEEKSTTDTNKPVILSAPKNNKKDVLTQIKGIGPKVEEQLNAAGIYHFEQIANWTEENIAWLEENTTFAHRAKKDLWVKQAKALV
ncbi:hypothetical protein C9926_00940 [Sulfurovum lithotrophicum]|nr:hypothetical protein C9926_00940 [Sulfurovum lithotrophicum]